MLSASLSSGTIDDVEASGVNVGYLTEVSRRKAAMSIGVAAVKSGISLRQTYSAHLCCQAGARPILEIGLWLL